MRPVILLITGFLFSLFGTSHGAKSKGPGKHDDKKAFSQSKYVAENLDKACKLTDDEGTSLNESVITCSPCSLCDIGPYGYYDKTTATVIEASFCSMMIHKSLDDYTCNIEETLLERKCGTSCDLNDQLQFLLRNGSQFTYAFCKGGIWHKKCNFDKIGFQDIVGLKREERPCKTKEVFQKLLGEACFILNEDTGERHVGECCPHRCTVGPATLTYSGNRYILSFCDDSKPEAPEPIVSALKLARPKKQQQQELLPAISNMQVLQPMKLSRPPQKKKRKKQKPKISSKEKKGSKE